LNGEDSTCQLAQETGPISIGQKKRTRALIL